MRGLLPSLLFSASQLVCQTVGVRGVQAGRDVPATLEPQRQILERVRQVLLRAAGEDPDWFARRAYVRPESGGRAAQGTRPSDRTRWRCGQDVVFDLCVAYGMRPVRNVEVREQEARISVSVYDPALQIGIRMLPDRFPTPRERREDFDVLIARGYRLRTLPGNLLCFTASAAEPPFRVAAEATALLDEVTGRDSGLAALFGDVRARVDLGTPLFDGDQLSFRIDPRGGYERRECDEEGEHWRRLMPAPKPGRLVILHVPVRPATRMVVEQDGAPGVHVEAPGASTILPPWFDPSRPFRVTVRTGTAYSREHHAILVGLGP